MVLPAAERPKRLRTILLAYPKRITKKYVAPIFTGKFHTGVRKSAIRGSPKENWRLSHLAIPTRKVPKYVFVEDRSTGVSPSALTVQTTQRTDDMSKPKLRNLLNAEKAYRDLGPAIVKHLKKTTAQTWNTIYNYYQKQQVEIQRKKDARMAKQLPLTTVNAKSEKEEKDKRIAAWCAIRAQPKRQFYPPPIEKRHITNLTAIWMHANILAEPRIVTPKYKRPSIDPTYIDPLRVTPAARSYVASGRILELATNPAFKLIKVRPIIPGAVKRSALTCTVSPRFAELAEPKKKAAEKDSELKENPFQISPNALKAKPSARTKELAKPIER
ncbi:hypothetical protein RI129_005894 [Pyrocoelia pectoralis]|uniref:Testicular haploid expressed protein n=1 Tax=Pyrocoelia pectoralis TaxID=417401 RepID=A0AAN7VIM2_9COLE